MKKIFYSIMSLVLLSMSFLTYASDNDDALDELFANFLSSETFTLSVEKQDTDSLSLQQADIINNADYRKLNLDSDSDSDSGSETDSNGDSTSENSTDTQDNESDTVSDLEGIEVSVDAYISSDNNKLYVFPKPGTLGYPNYLHAQVREHNGAVNTEIKLSTNLSDLALNLQGSNSREVRVSVKTMEVMVDLFESAFNQEDFSEYEESTQSMHLKQNVQFIKSVKQLVKNLKDNNIKLKTLDENPDDEQSENSDSSSDVDSDMSDEIDLTNKNLVLTLTKMSTEDLVEHETKVRANQEFLQLGNNTYVNPKEDKAYLFVDVSNKNHPHSLELQLSDDVLSVGFKSNLTHERLNFDGSNNSEIHITFSPMDMIDVLSSFDYGDLFSFDDDSSSQSSDADSQNGIQ